VNFIAMFGAIGTMRYCQLIDVHKSFGVVRKAIKRRARVTLCWKQLATHSVLFISHAINQNAFSFSPLWAHFAMLGARCACACSALSARREKQQAAGFGLGEKLLKKFGSSGKLLQVNELWFRRQKPRVCCCCCSKLQQQSPEAKNNLEPERNMRMELYDVAMTVQREREREAAGITFSWDATRSERVEKQQELN
jgi:hypothetical protein